MKRLVLCAALAGWALPASAAPRHELQVGTGVFGYFASAAPSPGPSWDVRYAFTPHPVLSLEAGYVGGLGDSAGPGVTVANLWEGDVRVNPLPRSRVSPYLLTGIGWGRFSGTDTRSVNAYELPVGAGADFHINRTLVAGGRFTYRTTPHQHLGDNFASADNWQLIARFGAQF